MIVGYLSLGAGRVFESTFERPFGNKSNILDQSFFSSCQIENMAEFLRTILSED